MDLLKFTPFNRFLKKRPLQFALQAPFVAVFAFVIVTGLFGSQFADRNLATVVTWTLWWAGIIFTFLLFGRAWCMVCPWAAVADWVQRMAFWRVNREPLTLGLKWPARLRNLYPIAFAFLLITWAEFAFDMVMSPRNTAILALVMLLAAVVVALLYERRTFCRYICPIGGMIGAYASCSTLEIGARDRSVCAGCHTKECLTGSENGYGCPVYEYPGRMETAFYCTMCTECVKTCPHDNIALNVRPVASELLISRERPTGEAVIAVLAAGIALFHGLTMIPWWFDVQQWLYDRWETPPLLVATSGLLLFVSLIWLVYYGFSRAAGPGSFNRQAFALIPLALFFHLGHNCLHLFGEGEKVKAALSDPFGWNRLSEMQAQAMLMLQPCAAVQIANWCLVVAGCIISLVVVWKRGRVLRERVAMSLAVAFFTAVYVWMLNQPMMMRMPDSTMMKHAKDQPAMTDHSGHSGQGSQGSAPQAENTGHEGHQGHKGHEGHQ